MNQPDDRDQSAAPPPTADQPAAGTPDSDAPATEVMAPVAATAVFTPAPAAPPAAYAPGGDLRGFVAAPAGPPGPRRRNLAVVIAVAAVVVVLVGVVAAVAVARWQTADRGPQLPATTPSTATTSGAPSPLPSDPLVRPTRSPRTGPTTRAPYTQVPHTQAPHTQAPTPGPFPTAPPRHTPRPPATKLPWER
ncbi:MAG: hypothetical protein FWH11_11680 [Micrococcales bacterium]|nr:hypothetical protein [Micrococcales bacterium]